MLCSLCFGTNITPYHPYIVSTHPIQTCSQYKDLGVILCADLSWSNHLSHITNQAYKKLGLLRHTLSLSNNSSTKRLLYVFLVRSQLVYCSPIWRPHHMKDIKLVENVQHRATKFIVNDFSMDYKSRLLQLKLLPLSMLYELNDICFFVKSLKNPHSSFNILDFVKFSHNSTRSGSTHKLVLPLSLSYDAIAFQLKQIFWDRFTSTYDTNNSCSLHYCCPCSKCQGLSLLSF